MRLSGTSTNPSPYLDIVDISQEVGNSPVQKPGVSNGRPVPFWWLANVLVALPTDLIFQTVA